MPNITDTGETNPLNVTTGIYSQNIPH